MNLASQIPNRRAFTLLEVILAMALAVIVIGAIGTAVHVNLRAFDSGRRDVEEARLAHALLRRIADDIRGAVQYDPQLAEEILKAATSGSSTSSAIEDAVRAAEEAGVDSASAEQLASAVSQYASNLAESTTLPPVAGLYGNRYELQVDVSRLPRIDQLGQSIILTADGTSVDRVSDMKTVTYYVVGLGGAVGGPSLGGTQAGLIRRELDRAVTAFAAETGSLYNIDLNLSPIAPEVVGIEFWYTDGSQWYEYWDSVERQGLPVAIEVTLYIAQPRDSSGGLFGLGRRSDLQVLDNARTYKTVVYIPSARPPKITTESESTEETSSSGSSSTTGSSGNPGG